VTHLGYYRTEEEAARVYDKVSISLHGDNAQTNFPIDQVGGRAGGRAGRWVRCGALWRAERAAAVALIPSQLLSSHPKCHILLPHPPQTKPTPLMQP